MTNDITPRVWVGCLACYNGGALVGDWFDAADAPTSTDGDGDGEFNAQVKVPPMHLREQHEELWVMDLENFQGFADGEMSPSEAVRLGKLIAAIQEDHVDPRVVAKYVEITGAKLTEWDAPTRDDFNDRVHSNGTSNLADYAHEYMSETGSFDEESVPEAIRYAIDWEQVGEHLTSDASVEIVAGTLYVIE